MPDGMCDFFGIHFGDTIRRSVQNCTVRYRGKVLLMSSGVHKCLPTTKTSLHPKCPFKLLPMKAQICLRSEKALTSLLKARHGQRECPNRYFQFRTGTRLTEKLSFMQTRPKGGP